MANRSVANTLARATVEVTCRSSRESAARFFTTPALSMPDAFDFGTEHLASDAGVGLRLDLPVGPLKIDYGIPIQKDNNTNGGKIQFSVGYQF